METVTIEGVTLPLKPTPASKIWPALGVLSKDAKFWDEAEWKLFLTALFWSIRRAGGEITEDWLALNVDLHNLGDVMTAFAKVNTLNARGAQQGEAAGGSAPMTGLPSPATSSPQPDGAGNTLSGN